MNIPALRATARIARRQTRASRARSVLVIALVAIPITALVGAGTAISTVAPSAEERATAEMGTADVMIYAATDVKMSTVRAAFPGARIAAHRTVAFQDAVRGSLIYMRFIEPSLGMNQPPNEGMFSLQSGRAPRAAGEAAIDPGVLHTAGLAIGDRLKLDDLSVTVTGTVVRPLSMREPVAIVGRGTLDGRDDAELMTVLIDLPEGTDVGRTLSLLRARPPFDQILTERRVLLTREEAGALGGDGSRDATAGAFAVAVLGLFATGLIVAAAFVVGLKRQLRMIGLIGAAGGDPWHVRAIVLFNGATLGFAGSVVGTVCGIAVILVFRSRLGAITGVQPGSLKLNLPVMAAALILGTIGAALAALAPARAAARSATVDALAMRAAPPVPAGRFARRGLAIALAGTVVTGASAAASEGVGLAIGLVAMLGGLLLAIPLLVTALGRIASGLPTVWRLAARDTSRYGRRTAAALAAATLALAAPVAASAVSLSEDAISQRGGLSGGIRSNQLLVTWDGDDGSETMEDLRARMTQAFPGATFAEVRYAVFPVGSFTPRDGSKRNEPLAASIYGNAHRVNGGSEAGMVTTFGVLTIGSPELLRALDATEATRALASGKVVSLLKGTTDNGAVFLQLPPGGDGPENGRSAVARTATAAQVRAMVKTRRLPAVEVDRPGTEGTRFLISEAQAARLGMIPHSYGQALFDNPRSLTERQIARAKDIAARHPDAYVRSTKDFEPPSNAALRAAITGSFALIALGIVGVAVALVRSEARRDHAILSAVGAGPRVRRGLAGASAALLAILAALIAVPAGFAPLVVFQAAREGAGPLVVPWMAIIAVLCVVPLVAGLSAAALSREPKSGAMLQPIA